MKKALLGIALLSLLLFLSGCGETPPADGVKTGTLVLSITDKPLEGLEEVKITISEIDVHLNGEWKNVFLGTKEFDLIAVSEEYVFLNSIKSTLDSKDVNAFVKEISLFWEFFPEYRSKKLIGLLASLSVDKSVLTYAERKGFLVLAVGMEIMEIQNRPDFEPKRWIYKA